MLGRSALLLRALPRVLSAGVLGVFLSLAPALAPKRAEALLLFKMRQVAGGIEVTGGGTYSTAGLTFVPANSLQPPYSNINPQIYTQSQMDSYVGYLLVGPGGSNTNGYVWQSTGISSGPEFFGDTVRTNVDLGSSISTAGQTSLAGIDPTLGYVILPYGDVTPCPTTPCEVTPSTTLFQGLSFEDLQIIPGTYIWSWGGTEDQKFQLDIEVPGPLPALGGAAAFAWSRRLRRRVDRVRRVSGARR